MKFSLRFKNHDSVIKLIIGIMVVVGIIIIANIIIIVKMTEDASESQANNKTMKGNDFVTQSKLNASKNDIFLLK